MERQSNERSFDAPYSALSTDATRKEHMMEHNKPGGYISQQDLIKEKMLEYGITEDMYTTACAGIRCYVQSRYDDKTYSEDWRKWKSESRCWDYYFAPQPFPAQEPDCEAGASSISSTLLKEETSQEEFVVDSSSQAGLEKSVQRGTMRGHAATQRSSRAQYLSLAGYMRSKASFMGYRKTDFDGALNDKYREARNRFPLESIDWQTWWAESAVWAKYFKHSIFPEKEPPRLSTNSMAQRSPGNSDRSRDYRSGTDWYRPSTKVNSHHSPKDERTDSYRPSNNERTDSYRPSRTSTYGRLTYSNSYRVEEDFPLSNVPADNNLKVFGGQCRDSANSTMAHANSNLQKVPTSQPSGTTQSTTWRSPNNAGDKQVLGPQPQEYQPLEKTMERKAKLQKIDRHLFFQVLQKKRDLANATHRGCSKQYKHWLADSLTWVQLFRDPFPEKEPVGSDLHSQHCVSTNREAAVVSNPRPSEKLMGTVKEAVKEPVREPVREPVKEALPGNSESCWKEYAQHHNSTDLDRLVMEEQVKREGALRMVLDEHTGEVINLKVFDMRTRLRALRPRLNNLASTEKETQVERYRDTGYSSGQQKRKARGPEGDEGSEKRARR